MLDIRFIRDNAEAVQTAARQKGYDVDIEHLLKRDKERRETQTKVDELRQERNELSAKFKGHKPLEEELEKGRQIKTELAELEDHLRVLDIEVETLLKKVPNMPLSMVPIGASEDENVVIKTVGSKPEFDFEPRNHWDIALVRDWIDKERAAKVAGARFAYIKGGLVRLQWAMMNFAMDVLTDETIIKQLIEENNLNIRPKAFTPILPPAMIRTEVYEQTARLDGEEVTYKLADDDLWMNASAEHSLCPMYKDEIIDEQDLPIRYAGYTTAFRREAGTYGKDMEGIIRLHQFDKFEMQTFSTPETSLDEHYLMVAVQEYLMKQLELPYQVLEKCTADIGGPNAKGIDIEVWLPGQNKYRETHTADLITDYQTRRLQTRLRRDDESLEFAHTNDATAFSQRPLVGIIENNQTKDGEVRIPRVLQKYLGGKEIL